MSFNSPTYILFLLIVVIFYWVIPQVEFQLFLLVIASLIFYSSLLYGSLLSIYLQWYYIPLFLLITIINWQLGKSVAFNKRDLRTTTKVRKRSILWLGIILNILLLAGFKYIPFLLGTVSSIYQQFNNTPLVSLQDTTQWVADSLVVPLGISFFTFESIAFLVDSFKGQIVVGSLLQFTTYKLFFPKLISGPITAYDEFYRQINQKSPPRPQQFTEGVWLIAIGIFKKALIADRLGILVELCFSNAERAGSTDLWLGIIAYSLQLYLDFSGYVDMARGSAMLLGFNLPENFDFPYFSTSIADFWRKWHMTLGNWLRQYLYFPLGGSKVGLTRTCFNLILVMLIAGIWHGAAWGFLVWGGLHGLALAVHRLIDVISKKLSILQQFWQHPGGILVAWFLTQGMVLLTWVFFRLPNLEQAKLVFNHLWGHKGDIQFAQQVYQRTIGLNPTQLSSLLAILWLCLTLNFFMQRHLKLDVSWHLKLFMIPLILFIVWLLAPEGGLPYIYFNF